jgi:hypothetical protein
MALSDGQLERIEKFLCTDPARGNGAAFRAEFPGVSLTRCDARDVQGESPFRAYPGFDLYLVDTREHCVRLTADPFCATGVLLAKRS